MEPSKLDLQRLFRDRRAFDSEDALRAAGFDVKHRSSSDSVMVASHPSAPGLLFKKFRNTVSAGDQHDNYATRVRGAGKLRSFIEAEGLRHVVVPQKVLLQLPRSLGSGEVLVVERLAIMDAAATSAAYRDIDKDLLRELCEVIHRFPGLDSGIRNVPFTTRGSIAFIDTEKWERSKSSQLKRIGTHLSPKRMRRAQKILDELAGW
jgi:hypothetical protein